MKLVRSANLWFQEGTSDKVYEVDLCEVGPDRWVVNFRYGRRGKKLNDGTKTVMPVSKAEAERIFDKLVKEKVTAGYRHGEAPEPVASQPAPPQSFAPAQDPRMRAVLERLQKQVDGGWSLDRVIWRAGLMRLKAAEPHLIEILKHSKAPMRTYACCWALARCGSVYAIAELERARLNPSTPHEERMATEALRAVVPPEHRSGAPFVEATKRQIPSGLGDLMSGPAEAFTEELSARLDANDRETLRALHPLYVLENEHVRPGLLHALRKIAVNDLGFFALRAIYKAAEVRSDGEAFGIIAHRIERSPATYVPYYYYGNQPQERQAFSPQTKKYLRRRTWRTMRKLGELESPDYVRMALGVLLAFSDDDEHEVRGHRKKWDRYAPYWAFNFIIYGNSKRYHPSANGKTFYCHNYKPGDPAPVEREEYFPELWDRSPQALLHLLDESRCDAVHEFAARALRSQKDFLAGLDLDAIIMLLTRPYAVTAQLGFELVEKRYDPQHPNIELVRVVITCRSEPARRKARHWIEADRYRFIEETELMAAIAGSEFSDNRVFARNLLRGATMSEEKARIIVARLIAVLKSLGDADSARAQDLGETLERCFARQIATLGLEVVRDLMRHPLEAVQVIAGDILLLHDVFSRDVPEEVLMAMLDSEHASVRARGARLLSQLTDELLRARAHLVLHLTTHELEELRNGIRPALARLAVDPVFAADLARALIQALTRKAPEGVHAHLLSILTTELAPHLGKMSATEIWKLLNARSTEAQELGGRLMAEKLSPEELSVAQLVKLFSHDVLAVRRAAWSFAERSLPRLQQAMATSVRLLDAKWDDSRQFAFELFRTKMTKQQLTPAILVAICDSIRDDVQQFGRELITRYFEDADGQEYLLKLSEHPSAKLQLFATNYLERYAAGNLERLAGLVPYFQSVLSRVNKARVAKLRCFDFLRQEALASREAAELAAGIMARQSATIAIEYRAKAIETMLLIRRRHPDIEMPLELIAEDVRNAI